MSNIEEHIVPIKIAHLANLVAERKRISLQEALTFVYVNPMFPELYDEHSKWWYLDTESLYHVFEKRRKAESKGVSFTAFEFYVYCIERYASGHSLSSLQTMALFDCYGVDNYILDNFDLLHTQDITYVLGDIERFIQKRK